MPAPLAPINLQVTPFMPVPLIQAADLVYQGGFKVPTVFDSGGSCLVYRPDTNTLWLANSLATKIGELSILPPVIGTAAQMARATLVQSVTDITQGQRTDPAFSQTPAIAGLIVDDSGRLIVSVVSTYDAGGTQSKSHLISGVNFSALPPIQPISKVEATAGQPQYQGPGFTAGYMLSVPAAYQASLGASYLTGNGCLSIITRTSWGPSLTAFDPSLVGNAATITGYRLLAYDDIASSAHHTLGELKPGTKAFSGVTRLYGAIWPSHTRSVLFLGRTGTPPVIYGTGTNDIAKDGYNANGSQTPPYTPCTPCANPWVYDPADVNTHGYHGYPYTFFVWAYDADDLVAVKAGTKQPWEVVPYATWDLVLPNMPTGKAHMVGGVTYKEATKQIFVSARGGGDSSLPIIYVFQIP